MINENERSSFTELVEFIRPKLTEKELKDYDDLTNLFLTRNNLLLDDNARKEISRRGSQRRGTVTDLSK